MNAEINQREFQERFTAALETWRFHVASYWTRTTYFAFFQVAAFSGLWSIVTARHHPSSAAFLSLAACALAIIWFVNGIRMQEYITYWWQRAAAIEKDFNISPERCLVLHHEHLREPRGRSRILGSYSTWMKAVPIVFLAAWLWMFLWSLTEIWQSLHH